MAMLVFHFLFDFQEDSSKTKKFWTVIFMLAIVYKMIIFIKYVSKDQSILDPV